MNVKFNSSKEMNEQRDESEGGRATKRVERKRRRKRMRECEEKIHKKME